MNRHGYGLARDHAVEKAIMRRLVVLHVHGVAVLDNLTTDLAIELEVLLDIPDLQAPVLLGVVGVELEVQRALDLGVVLYVENELPEPRVYGRCLVRKGFLNYRQDALVELGSACEVFFSPTSRG